MNRRGLSRSFRLLLLGPLLAASTAGLPGSVIVSSPTQEFGFEHTILKTFQTGERLTIRTLPRGPVEWMTFYFRVPGVRSFQARPLVRTKDGAFSHEFDTSTLPADRFEYYLEAQKGGQKTTLPADAPSALIQVLSGGGERLPPIPENLPPPEAEEAKWKLPFHANGSLQGVISRTGGDPPALNPAGSGNVQIGFDLPSGSSWGVKIDSNTSLTNTPPSGDNSINLSNMSVAVVRGTHALRMGDLNLNESEYTAYGIGRRGIEYALDGPKLYLHLFDVNTQQLRGFRGFGVPPSGVNLMGGAAGYKLFQDAFSLRAIYIAGQDNPSRAANAVSSSFFQRREGRVMAVLQETRLFQKKLSLKAEFARSRYDGNLTDEVEASDDNAWNVIGNLSLGGLTLGAAYRHIGRNFNSVGLAYLANDRRSLETSLMLSLGKVSLQGQYVLQRDNIRDDPTKYTTSLANGQASLNLSFSSAASGNLGWRLNAQKTRFGTQTVDLQDTRTNEYTAALNLNLPGRASLTFNLTNSDLTSRVSPETDRKGWTLNIGASVRAGEWLVLAPTFGLSRSELRSTGEANATLNAFVSGEVFFVPRILAVALTGSFNRMEMSVLSISKALDVIGGLNFYLGRLIKVENLLLTVKGQYRRNDMSGIVGRDTRLLAQTDFAF